MKQLKNLYYIDLKEYRNCGNLRTQMTENFGIDST